MLSSLQVAEASTTLATLLRIGCRAFAAGPLFMVYPFSNMLDVVWLLLCW